MVQWARNGLFMGYLWVFDGLYGFLIDSDRLLMGPNGQTVNILENSFCDSQLG